MRADEALFWLSARREGSWQQFRAAVEELNAADHDSSINGVVTSEPAFPLHQQLRLDLERLAHVEFFARECSAGWRVAPPTLAAHTTQDGVRAILCGARSPALRQSLVQAVKETGGETVNHPGVPLVIRVDADDLSDFAELSGRTGIPLQGAAPLAILSHLPPCDPPSAKQPQGGFPTGAEWSIHRFDARELAWQQIERREIQVSRVGLYRFSHRFHRNGFFLCWNNAVFQMPRANALYVMLKRARRTVFQRDAAARTLRVPAICRPPRLLERALVLCSGLPPSYDPMDASLTYSDITPEIAALAAELLRQPL